MEAKEGTDGTVKKRRRAGWDAPSTTSIVLPSPSSSSSASVSGTQISSTSSMAPMISQAQQQAQVQMLLAQQALAQSLAAAAASSANAPNMVQLSQQSTFTLPTPQPPPAPTGPTRLDCRLYIGSLHYSITEADIRALFSGFGTVTRVDMSFEPTSGKSKGFCFLEFADPMSIYAAMDMNGFEIAARKVKVGRPSGAPVPPSIEQRIADAKAMLLAAGGSGAGSIMSLPNTGLDSTAGGTTGGGPKVFKSKYVSVRNIRKEFDPTTELQPIFNVFGPIKHCIYYGDEVTLINPTPTIQTGHATAATSLNGLPIPITPTMLTVITRTALIEFTSLGPAMECVKQMHGFLLAGQILLVECMDEAVATRILQKELPPSALVSSTKTKSGTSNGKGKSTTTSSSSAAGAMQARCIVHLENIVPVEEAGDPHLRREVGEEGERYGPLDDVQVFVDTNRTPQGPVVVVVLTYAEPEAAMRAYEAMNGRYFGGRMVTAHLK